MVVTTSCYATEARKLQLGRHGMSYCVTTLMAWLTKIWLICSYHLQIAKENELIADSLGPITELSQKPACYGFLRKECKTTQWISQHHHIDIEWELLSIWKSITELKLNKHQTMWNKPDVVVFFSKWIISFTKRLQTSTLNPLTPKIWLLILPSKLAATRELLREFWC